jgi:hypothetical protein
MNKAKNLKITSPAKATKEESKIGSPSISKKRKANEVDLEPLPNSAAK